MQRQERHFVVTILVTVVGAMGFAFLGLGRFGIFVLVGFMVSISAAGIFTRCPRCGVRIGYINTGSLRRDRPGLASCGNCGLHRDEEIRKPKRD